MRGMELRVGEADLDDPRHGEALVEIIDSYACGTGGQGRPLTAFAREQMVAGLRAHPMATVLFGFVDDEPVGVAVCVWSFSTFGGKASVNVHDLAVLPDHQGRGIGTRLLEEVEARARVRDCCKMTLEVNDANEGAKRLYESFGFGPWQPATWFVSKPL